MSEQLSREEVISCLLELLSVAKRLGVYEKGVILVNAMDFCFAAFHFEHGNIIFEGRAIQNRNESWSISSNSSNFLSLTACTKLTE